MIYIGVDPGKSGGLAMITEKGVAKTFPFSEEKTIDIVRTLEYNEYADKAICYIENVHAMPGQGVTSMFNFGKNFGFILGCFKAHNIEPVLVSPQKWKRFYNLGHDKQDSIDLCHKLFPDVSLRRTNRCTTDSDGMAEALLIANYGKEMKNEQKKICEAPYVQRL